MPSAALLTAEGIQKSYGGVHALAGVSLRVGSGEVHGLIGENGCGKSTLLGVLSGQVPPDAGEVRLDGERLALGDPTGSVAAGIATVTQETTLVPDLTVAENILLGRRAVRDWRGLDWRASRARAAAVLSRLELDLDPRATVRQLRPDEQQMVEIARAISMNARILVLDEPTSSLTDDEIVALFVVVQRLRQEGVSTIFVSHRLEEMIRITDRITVLRDGRNVTSAATSSLTEDRLVALMVGRELKAVEREASAASIARHPTGGVPRLKVRGLGVKGLLEGVSLELAPGETVGLAGLVGAGRGELLKALFGLQPTATGTVELDGRRIGCRTPGEAMGHGFAYVPAERKLSGLVLQMSVRENLVMASTAGASRMRRPNRDRELGQVSQAFDEFNVAGSRSDHAPVGTLSGGNQQKIVLAKWLATDPDILLLDEPTRGVDVGAKAEIYRLLERAREAGLTMLVSSSENPELLLLCDRILVMFRGRIVSELDRAQASETAITLYATGFIDQEANQE